MYLASPQGRSLLPQPTSRQQGQETAPFPGKLAAASHTIDTASTERGVLGSTRQRWKCTQKQAAATHPLQALSSTPPKKQLICLLTEISWAYLAPLRSPPPRLPLQTGEARQGEAFIVCSGRGVVQSTVASHTTPGPHSRKAARGGGGRGQVGCIPPCWVSLTGGRNCLREEL